MAPDAGPQTMGARHGCQAQAVGAGRGYRGTLHGDTVRGAERWRASESPHRLPFGVEVMPGGRVTVEPCALVLVGEGRSVVVRNAAQLVVEGREGAGVRFDAEAASPGPGAWQGLAFWEGASPESRLAGLTVASAGAADPAAGAGASLRVGLRGGLAVEGLVVENGADAALAFEGGGHLATPGVRVTVRGGARDAPLARIDDVNEVGAMPTFVSDRADPEVWLLGRQRVLSRSALWAPRGARLRVRRGLRVMVQGPDAPLLRVGAGLVLRFEAEAELAVGWELPGDLAIEGEPGLGEVQLVDAPARGPEGSEGAADAGPRAASWTGVFFGHFANVARSRLRNVLIRGAGAPSAAALPGCLPTPPPPDLDAAMVTLAGFDGRRLFEGVRLEAGPARGLAIAQSGEISGDSGDVTAPLRGVDVGRAGVACAQSWPRVGGVCRASLRCQTGF